MGNDVIDRTPSYSQEKERERERERERVQRKWMAQNHHLHTPFVFESGWMASTHSLCESPMHHLHTPFVNGSGWMAITHSLCERDKRIISFSTRVDQYYYKEK